jgi:tRNA threonylcarbamoyladenosine biosynthesis protein TsaB
MLVLGINAATPHLALALVEDGRLVAELGQDVGSDHSETLFVLLETLFAWTGRRRDELSAVGVAHGPGGFTGVRTALACGKTIAQVLGIPVYGIDTLAALAMQFPGAPRVAARLAARRGLVFAGLYGPAREVLEAPVMLPFADWLAGEQDVRGLLCVGEGATRHRQALELAGCVVPPDAQLAAGATSVALHALARLAAGAPSDGAALAPLYLREPQAVVNWEAARAGTKLS